GAGRRHRLPWFAAAGALLMMSPRHSADIIETMTRRSFVRTGAALTAASQLAKGSPNGKITFGMIGAGARAHELMQHLQKYPEKAEIVAVVDAYTGRVARALERTGGRAKVHKNYHDLLADKSIDAVCIATPDHWH